MQANDSFPNREHSVRPAKPPPAFDEPAWRARAARRSATVAVVLNLVGMPLGMMVARSVPGVPQWPGALSIGAGVVLLAVIAARWRRGRARLFDAAFFVNTIAIAFALFVTNYAYAESERPWPPFQAVKLGLFTVALLATSRWVGLSSIAVYAGVALINFCTFSPEARARLAIGEPWATIAIAVFATVIFVYRMRKDSLEAELHREREIAAANRRLAAIFLDVRDRANTPLQTITLTTAHLRRKHPELQRSVMRIERAVERLKAMDTALRAYDQYTEWDPTASGERERK
jgi:hypothetical protein